MSRLKAVTIFFVAALLTGCAPTVAGSSGGSITFSNAMTFNVGQQYEMAIAHCAKYGKVAEDVPDDRADGMHTFKCVSP